MSESSEQLSSVILPKERRFIDAIAMFVVALVSLVLLVYVAYGEAKRTYEQFQIEKLVAQGQVVQSAVEGFVRPGLPIHQFVGFNGLAEPMVKADPLLDAIAAYDVNGKRVFMSGETNANAGLINENDLTTYLTDKNIQIRRSGDLLQVVLPVRNRFEQVGQIVLNTPRGKIAEQVETAFVPVVVIGVAGAIGFAFFVFFISPYKHGNKRRQWVAGAFAMTFMAVAVMVVSTLISVYSQGAQARTKSLADSLGLRLDDLVIYNINLDDITGIIALFGDYKRLNPDLRAAALIVDGKVRAHVDPNRRGVEWDKVESDHEYTVRLSPEGAAREVLIKVAIPRDIVFQQVFRSVKNFAALFVASGFFAALFMGLARSLQLLANAEPGQWSEHHEKATIDLIKPVFFLAVFVEHLSYAFLPSLMQTYVAQAGLPAGYASAPFMAYYLFFALSLIPAGRIEAKIGARSLMLFGLLCAGAGMVMMGLTSSFSASVLARALSGCGQGMLFIGVQAYVLANSSPERKTQAGASIVFGFQAGMIAGMAIGSLLVSYVGSEGIFFLGAGIAVATAMYGWLALPSRVSGGQTAASLASAWNDMAVIIKDGQFAKTILLVGVPAKAVLTGIVLFAMPLLLANQGFPKEDIGQITMAYAGAVIIASHFASMKADRSRDTERLLFQGACLTGAGLIVISAAGFPSIVNWATNPGLGTFLIVVGALMVGVAHGLINAPVVTHVTETQIAQTVGTTNIAAAYRLMERVGHVAGPLIMGQIFLFTGVSWVVLSIIGCVIFLMGALFLSPDRVVPSDTETRSA